MFSRTRHLEEETPLADQLRNWEDDEQKKMRIERERFVGSSHVDVGGGAVRHLDHLERRHLNQLMCERPSGSSHVEDGGGAAQRLDHLRDLVELWDQGRGSWQMVESRPFLGVDYQQAFKPYE
jgi:hypothetical protein